MRSLAIVVALVAPAAASQRDEEAEQEAKQSAAEEAEEAAAEEAALERARQRSSLQLELGLRPGIGQAFYKLDRTSSLFNNNRSGLANVGVSATIRDRPTGLGASLQWNHAFQGFVSHYGTHLFDLRVSGSRALYPGHWWQLNLLLEAGGGAFAGGASKTCEFSISSCSEGSSVDVRGGAFVSMIALEFATTTRKFRSGFEIDYRYLVHTGSFVLAEHNVVMLARLAWAHDALTVF